MEPKLLIQVLGFKEKFEHRQSRKIPKNRTPETTDLCRTSTRERPCSILMCATYNGDVGFVEVAREVDSARLDFCINVGFYLTLLAHRTRVLE